MKFHDFGKNSLPEALFFLIEKFCLFRKKYSNFFSQKWKTDFLPLIFFSQNASFFPENALEIWEQKVTTFCSENKWKCIFAADFKKVLFEDFDPPPKKKKFPASLIIQKKSSLMFHLNSFGDYFKIFYKYFLKTSMATL